MGKKILFPLEAKFNRVMGIIRLLLKHDDTLSVRELTRMSGEHVDNLLPQVDAAKLLGFVKVRGDDVHLLNLGRGFYEDDAAALRKARLALLRSEPFTTAMELSRAAGTFTIDQLLEELFANNVPFPSNPEETKQKVAGALLQWAIHLNILSYDGEKKLWSVESLRS